MEYTFHGGGFLYSILWCTLTLLTLFLVGGGSYYYWVTLSTITNIIIMLRINITYFISPLPILTSFTLIFILILVSYVKEWSRMFIYIYEDILFGAFWDVIEPPYIFNI